MSLRKVRIEAASNGWILILGDTYLSDKDTRTINDRVVQRMVFGNWPDVVAAIEDWLGPVGRITPPKTAIPETAA